MQRPARGDLERVMVHYQVDEYTARQALALAPASSLLPTRGTGLINTRTRTVAGNGITLPWWLFSGLLSFGFGVIVGPALFATTEAGSRKLAELAKRKLA